jgi:hypothetical protein
MKIEIDIPEIDENEFEYLGIVPAQKGYKYYTGNYGSLAVWTDETESYHLYPCFRKKQSWKDKIAWPSVFREGTWVCNDEDGHKRFYVFETKPFYSLEVKRLRSNATDFSFSKDHICFDFDFFPDEFWKSEHQDSLVQVRHESPKIQMTEKRFQHEVKG